MIDKIYNIGHKTQNGDKQCEKHNAENQKRLATRTLQCIAPSNVETVNFRLNIEDSNMGSLTTLQNNMDDTKSIETRFVFES